MTTPPVEATSTDTPPPQTGTPAADKTLTQVDVDRIVADRVKRAEAKFADYGDLKAKASKLDDIEAANATDLEKAVKAARNEGRLEAVQRGNDALRKSEARALAAGARFRDATDAVAFLNLAEITVSDDGKVDADAIQSQLADLAKSKPYLLVDEAPSVPTPGQAGIGVAGGGVNLSDPRAADMAQIEADIRSSAKRRGN